MKSNLKQQSAKEYGMLFLSLVFIVTLIFPFVNLLHYLYPFTLFGKSAWIVVPVISLGLCYMHIVAIKKVSLSTSDMISITLVVLSWLIFATRAIVYSEQHSYLNMRYIATSLLFLLFMRYLLKDPFVLRVVAYAVVIQGLLVAVARSINYYFFPSLMVSIGVDGVPFINTAGELTRDLLLGSSISANHIVCGMFVLLALQKYKVIKLGSILFIMIQLFMMFSVFNTQSRFPIAISIMLFSFALLYVAIFKIRDLLMFVIVVIIVFFGENFSNFLSIDFFSRFTNEGSGGRLDKILLTLELIQGSILNFFIGSSFDAAGNATSVNGFSISDNSYGLVALSFGVPFALVYFAFLFNIILRNKSGGLSLSFLVYIIAVLGLTNSILWEPWIFTAFAGFFIISYMDRIPTNQQLCQDMAG